MVKWQYLPSPPTPLPQHSLGISSELLLSAYLQLDTQSPHKLQKLHLERPRSDPGDTDRVWRRNAQPRRSNRQLNYLPAY